MNTPQTTYQRVQQAATPQHGMMALATALDEIKSMLEPLMQPRVLLPADPWATEHWNGDQPLIDDLPSYRPDNRARIENGDVIVERASAEREVARAEFVAATQLYEFSEALSPADFTEAYIKGGPRWLYYTNRDVVMQMPLEFRRALVADVLLDSPSEADEIGRDILKFDESVPEGTQVEAHRRDYGPLG